MDYVRNDLMGITREDLVASIARHVDSSVHLFEKWGLPIWTDENGAYVHEGRWQLMINGESYKVVVAEAAKNALLESGVGEIIERVFIVGPLMDGERVRWRGRLLDPREQVLRLQGEGNVLVALGGAVHVFKPRSSGEGMGRAWYPPWNSGSSAYFTLQAGAEMTCQEVRFHSDPLQGRLRSGRCVVPALQEPGDQLRRAAPTWSSAVRSSRSGAPTAA